MYDGLDFSERREHPRVGVAMPVSYRGIRQSGDSAMNAITRDISRGGIRLLVDEFISVFTRLVVDISIPSTVKPVRVVSKVAWVRKRPHGDQYEVGMQFIDIPEEDRRGIFEFVDKSNRKPR
ncbi:MAG: PilZ domain-containing protein [Candidatus Omnitrophota bacterium]